MRISTLICLATALGLTSCTTAPHVDSNQRAAHTDTDADAVADAAADADAAAVAIADAAPPRPHRYPTAGDPCTTATDCFALPGVQCLAWPSGYCTIPCYPDGACDEGTCADLAEAGEPPLGLTCLRPCESNRECRDGYHCAWRIDGDVCAPLP